MYQLDKSISNFSFLFKIQKKLQFAQIGEPDQMPHFAASDLVLHCLPMSHKKDARLILVKHYCDGVLYPFAPRVAKTPQRFDLSECNRVVNDFLFFK